MNTVSELTSPKCLHRLACGECGWTMTILADTEAELTQCPWCGWEDLEISKLERAGVGKRIHCSTHGEIVVEILEHTISIDDFFSELYCPFCGESEESRTEV